MDGPAGATPAREELYSAAAMAVAWVSIDRWLALNIVARTLGLPSPRSLRRLGPGERGILAAHLAALLTFASGRLDVDLTDARGQGGFEATVGLAFQAEAAGACGPVRLDLPPQWLAMVADGWSARPDAAVVAAMRRLETMAGLELADTGLPLAAIAETGIADTVVFDGERFGVPTRRSGARARRRLRGWWSYQTRRRDRLPGSVRSGAASRTRVGSWCARGRGRSRNGTTMDSGSDDRKMDVLAAAPVEVVAELGRLTLRGDEVLGLERGSVLAFNRRRGLVDLSSVGAPGSRRAGQCRRRAWRAHQRDGARLEPGRWGALADAGGLPQVAGRSYAVHTSSTMAAVLAQRGALANRLFTRVDHRLASERSAIARRIALSISKVPGRSNKIAEPVAEPGS